MIFRPKFILSLSKGSIQRKLNSLLSIFVLILFISACGNEKKQEVEETAPKETFIDDVNAEETAADTSSTGVYQEEVIEGEESLQDALKSGKHVTKIEEGMSFCDCVKKNKKLSDIIMADETSDADFDKAMEELEAMKTGECEIMFPDQSNIEKQEEHQLKVKNCLR